jgi:hypothetical protein
MQRFGNPNFGLLKRMLDVIYEHGQDKSYDSDWVAQRIKETGLWNHGKWPERTINSYFSRNPELFEHCGRNSYRLRIERFRPIETPTPIDNLEDKIPASIKTTIYRKLRETHLVATLKLIHDDCCQICGNAIPIGGTAYSEGHHIKPFGRRGPDIPGNILILCPNNHVQCDYGAIRLEFTRLRCDPRHVVEKRFVDWHNKNLKLIRHLNRSAPENFVTSARQIP